MEKVSLPRIYQVAAAFFILTIIIVTVYLTVDVVAPLIIALLLAILARPMVRFLNEKWKLPSILAVSIAVVLGGLLIIGILTFLGFQIASFTDDLPAIQEKLTAYFASLQKYVSAHFGISEQEQITFISENFHGKDFISMSYLGSITNSFMYVVLIPIFTFLILIYRNLLLNFIVKLFPDEGVLSIQEILSEIKGVTRSYIVGLGLQVLAVALLTGIGYAIIGVKYFVFLAILTGLLNLVPYIGIIISCAFSCLLTIATGDNFLQVVWVLVVNGIVQMIDNNILQPKIVGSKVSVNALASMVGVIVGGSLAGVPGMFLAIPVLAILKVIFANVKGMEPFAYVISDDVPKTFDWNKVRVLYSRKTNDDSSSDAGLKENENIE